jgi:hypothetical protein
MNASSPFQPNYRSRFIKGAAALICGGSAAAGVIYLAARAPVVHTTHQILLDAAQQTAVSPRIQAEKQQALQLLENTPMRGGTRSMEFGVYQEHQFETPDAGTVKSINVQSKGGDVFVIHNTDPDVIVLAGKIALAPNTGRAREYARQFQYTLKQDGDKISATVSGPQNQAPKAFGVVRCIVIAPDDVTVTTSSGK